MMENFVKDLEGREEVNVFVAVSTGGNFGVCLKMKNCDVTITDVITLEDDNEQMITFRLDSTATTADGTMWRITSGKDEAVVSFF